LHAVSTGLPDRFQKTIWESVWSLREVQTWRWRSAWWRIRDIEPGLW
jgi:hypothetical protein